MPTAVTLDDGFLAQQSACGGWHTLVLIRWTEGESEFETETESESEQEQPQVNGTTRQGNPIAAGAAAIAVTTVSASSGSEAEQSEAEPELDALLGIQAGPPRTPIAVEASPLSVTSTAREKRRQDRASAYV